MAGTISNFLQPADMATADGGPKPDVGSAAVASSSALSEEMTKLACQAGRVGAWQLNLTTGALELSNCLFEILDIDPSEWAGTFDGLFTYVHPDDRDGFRARCETAFAAATHFDHRFRFTGKRGTNLWLQSRGAIVRDETAKATAAHGVFIDVSDQMREQSSEEHLRLATAAAAIGTFSIDARTGLAFYSAELTAMLGVPGAKAVKLEQAFSRIHRDDMQRVQTLYAAAQDPSGDGRLLMDFRFVRPGGEIRWMTWSGQVLFEEMNGGREAVRIIGACVDITDRKTAEANLLASEARYRCVVEGSLQGIVIQQHEKIVYANSAMARIFGYENAHDLIGRSTFDDFIAPDERAVLRARTRAAMRGETVQPHPGWRGFRRDGQEIWLSTMAHFAEWQGQPAVVSFYLDITERKSGERRLAETLRLMKVACAAGHMGTWHYNSTENTLDYSDEGLALLSIAKTTFNRAITDIESVVHPDDISARRKAIVEAIARRQDLDMEFRVVKPDVGIRWVMVRGHVLPHAPGKAFDALGVILDITDRKQAEERQQILIQELDHRVKNALANIQLVIERSSEQSHTLDAFKSVLQGRVMAMVQTHTRLSQGKWSGVSLADIINDSLQPFASAGNSRIEGPPVILKPSASQALAMAVFELATNAAKYGALGQPGGIVSVRWSLTRDGTPAKAAKTLVITWTETVPVKIAPASSRGYGTSVIKELVPYELKGSTSTWEIKAEGAYCRIEIPIRFLVT